VEYAADSVTRQAGICQSLGLFNWTDVPRLIAVRRDLVGSGTASKAIDFWSGAEIALADDEFITHRLPPRSAALWDILV
ncbi:MAG: hypothetical protein N3A66_10695, partial [Planctomycetota bacterium]|nr:hypothetical protein [Planctomycetota bacterium]